MNDPARLLPPALFAVAREVLTLDRATTTRELAERLDASQSAVRHSAITLVRRGLLVQLCQGPRALWAPNPAAPRDELERYRLTAAVLQAGDHA